MELLSVLTERQVPLILSKHPIKDNLYLTCRFILRFLQIQLCTARWRNSFSPHQIYKIFNTLAINLLGKG